MDSPEQFLESNFADVAGVLRDYHAHFANKPRFALRADGDVVYVLREDQQEAALRMSERLLSGADPGERLTVSHYVMDKAFADSPERFGVSSVTAHDVFADYGRQIIVKTGNPDISNAPYDFKNALSVKYLRGVIEMEVPIGFMVDRTKRERTAAFYKYIPGRNLDQLLTEDDPDLCNTMLWETAKLFSRLIENDVFFYDSHRFNNFYIESLASQGEAGNPCQHVLRLLDGEYIFPQAPLPHREREHMLKQFVGKALVSQQSGGASTFLDAERLEDFLMVCLGDLSLMKAYRDTIDQPPDVLPRVYRPVGAAGRQSGE